MDGALKISKLRMKTNIVKIFLFLAIFSVFVFPALAFAQIVPVCPETSGKLGEPGYVPGGCGWTELVQLAQNIMNFLIAIAISISAIAFAAAGFIYLTAAGSEEKIKRAHSIFGKVAIGLILVLTAWLIIYLISSTLLQDDYSILKPGN